MQNTLLVAGIVFVGAAIIGGGLKAFKVEVPVIETGVRQVLLGMFGALLILLAFLRPFGGAPESDSGADRAGDVTSGDRVTGGSPDDGAPTESEPVASPNNGASPASGNACVIRVTHQFAELKEEPDPTASGTRIPVGRYTVLDSTTVSWAGQTQRWLRLRVDGREGWLQDRAMFIGDRSATCP